MADTHARKGYSGHLPASGLTVSPSALAYALFALALLAMGWRAVSVFTTPSNPVVNTEFTAVADAIAGPGKTRVVEGDAGALLILIDGVEGSLSTVQTSRLRTLAGTLYPNAPTVTIEQFEFAEGLPGKPGAAALGELALLGCLVLLSGWFAFKNLTAQSLKNAPAIQAPAPGAPAHPAPDRVILQPPSQEPPARQKPRLDQVAALVQDKPQETAAIIRKWLRQEEGPA